MQNNPSHQSSPQAQQVCTSCKERKRKCDKTLPQCSSCSTRNLACVYSKPVQSSKHASDPLWCNFSSDADVQSIDFPTILFLDPGILQHGQIESSRVATPAPVHILQLLGDTDEIRVTASKFFENIHLWMPFISKKRFYELYLRSSFQSQPDIVLLLLSLKLITTLPPKSPRNPRTPLYNAVKHFYLEVEGSSIFSIPVLQAGVLVSLYELGHAIYPAAFLSIGACARYAHALGINGSRTPNARKVLTLVEVEERRRTWWAIIILDRFVSIGCPGRPFAAADPRLDDLLPTDDAAWDQGIVRLDDSFTLSSPMTGHMSKFALLCQAARLMGQVLRHVSSDSAIQSDIWMQMDRTLRSMAVASLNTDLPDYDQITFIYSALLALHTPWLCSDSASIADPDRSEHAKAVIQQISDRVKIALVEGQCFVGRDFQDVSPWGLFFAYRMHEALMCSGQEGPDSFDILKTLRETLLQLDLRWNAAGIYLQLLEAREATNNF